VRQVATPLLYSFPLAMRRSLVSLDSLAPEAGAGATGPDSLPPFRLGNASSRLPCTGKAFSLAPFTLFTLGNASSRLPCTGKAFPSAADIERNGRAQASVLVRSKEEV
jgi:hypothetical protein